MAEQSSGWTGRIRRQRAAHGAVLAAAVASVAACHDTRQVHDARQTPDGIFIAGARGPTVGPSDGHGNPVTPKVTADFQQVPQTNDWWSSLIWSQNGNAYSEPMFPHPLSARACAEGLEVGYPDEPVVDDRSYIYAHSADLWVGVDGLHAPDTRVAAYTDWTVTAAWDDGPHTFRATLGHGMPFVYLERVRGRARVRVEGGHAEADAWSRTDNVVALTVRGHDYALFSPPGTTWSPTGDAWEADVGSGGYFSVAVLPDRSQATLATFRLHAFAFPRDTHVSWSYDRAEAAVQAHFAVDAEAMDQGRRPAQSLIALYPHQWKHSDVDTLPGRYASPRGVMKLAETSSFDVKLPVRGLLPALPAAGSLDRGELSGLLRAAVGRDAFPPGAEGTRDSYWEGKAFGRVAGLIGIADEMGERSLRDAAIGDVERELEDWFDGRAPRFFHYNDVWRTLIGVPAMYGSDTQLNDHHFHFGYFIYAAAVVAQYDPEWARRWSPAIELLIRDVASDDRGDRRFPFLRYFDVYAGHSWASGTTASPWGNNEESSSEDLNFAAATALWGEITGHTTLRDLGLFLFATTSVAVEQYWFDVDHDVFPKGFHAPHAGIVWGAGAQYDTWFSHQPAFILGIQLTPMLTGSLRFGEHAALFREVLDRTRDSSGGQIHLWRDVLWMLEANEDPRRPIARWDDEHFFEPEFGSSMAYLYHYIHALDAFGTLNGSVAADTPLFAVLERAGRRTYVAYNAAAERKTVSFSDGFRLDVGPHALGRGERTP